MTTKKELEEEVLRLRRVVTQVQEDINWMLNEEKLLNPHVFEYLHKEADRIEAETPVERNWSRG